MFSLFVCFFLSGEHLKDEKKEKEKNGNRQSRPDALEIGEKQKEETARKKALGEWWS